MNFKRRVLAIFLIIAITVTCVSSVNFAAYAGANPIPPAGVPFKLDVILSPSKVPAGRGWSYSVVVRLSDVSGKPALAATDIYVTLTSSNLTVGSVDYGLLVSAGECYGGAGFQSTYKPGITTISASSPGLKSGSAVMTTVGNTPTKLVVTLAPSKMPNNFQGYYAGVTVELQDDAGNTAIAPEDLVVILSSSNITVATVQTVAIISEGTSFTQTWFYTTYVAGTTMVSASSPGLASGSAVMTTLTGGAATKLGVFAAPSKLLATGSYYYSSIVVQLQDAAGNPVIPSTNMAITLTSSDTTIGTVGSPVTLYSGNDVVDATFISTYKPGSTTITASFSTLSGQAVMTTVGTASTPTPTKLVVMLAPSELLPYSNYYFSSVRVQFQDDAGNPAIAPTDIDVTLASSDTSVGSVPDTVTIYVGDTFEYATFISTYKAGSTTITASALGLTSGQAVMTTVGNTPAKLVVTLAPSKMLNNGATYYAGVTVELQDDAGNPAIAPANIVVTLSSSNASVGTVDTSVTIYEGASFTQTWFYTTYVAGTTMVSASSPGLASGSAVMTTLTGGAATKLGVFAAPSKLLALNSYYSYPIVVQLQDAAGNPVIASTNMVITLASSDPMVGRVNTATILYSGDNVAMFVWFASTYQPGNTTITASSPGFGSNSTVITTGLRFVQSTHQIDLSDFPAPFVLGGVLNMTFVVGGTNPHGPFGWGAWTVDVMGGIGVASTLGHEASMGVSVAQAVDSDVATYDSGTGSVTVQWSAIASNSMIAVGSGAVNLISLNYNGTIPYKFVQNNTGSSIFSGNTGMSYGSDWGVDYAVIAEVNEPNVGPVLVVYGITGKGSIAASLILQNYQQYAGLLKGHAVIVKWQDLNGNNTPDLNDQYSLIEWVS